MRCCEAWLDTIGWMSVCLTGRASVSYPYRKIETVQLIAKFFPL